MVVGFKPSKKTYYDSSLRNSPVNSPSSRKGKWPDRKCRKGPVFTGCQIGSLLQGSGWKFQESFKAPNLVGPFWCLIFGGNNFQSNWYKLVGINKNIPKQPSLRSGESQNPNSTTWGLKTLPSRFDGIWFHFCSRVNCLRWICPGKCLTCFFYRFFKHHGATSSLHVDPVHRGTLHVWYSDSMAFHLGKWSSLTARKLPWKKMKKIPKNQKMSSKHRNFSGASCQTSGEYSFTQCSGHLWSQCFSQTVLITFRGGLALWWN